MHMRGFTHLMLGGTEGMNPKHKIGQRFIYNFSKRLGGRVRAGGLTLTHSDFWRITKEKNEKQTATKRLGSGDSNILTSQISGRDRGGGKGLYVSRRQIF